MSDTYAITETLSESATVTLYRGIRRQDNVPVVIKTLNAETPAPREIERLCHEYEIMRRLDSPYLLKPYELDQQKAQVRLILEDFDGEPLSGQLDRPLEIGRFLDIAVHLAAALADIHRQGIIHKDLKPANILFDPQTGAIKLTGFGIATRLMHIPTTPTGINLIEGSLAYMSPEQTGRMNRPVDYRTDFYSLGITFYKLLTDNLPFTAEDALGLVHSHIAGIPVPPHKVNPAVPVMLSRTILKLMSKMADDRYQSALGLQADLEHCQQKLLEQGTIPEFTLGLHDFSEILQISHKLYGRKQEIEQLLKSFKQVCSGKRKLLLISGYAGVGKTALVQELYKPITEANGNFIEGKFDQLQRNIPYLAWVQAFDGLVNMLLMESEAQLTKWKELILQAVGNIGRVLTEIIPNFEHIIGPQPEIPALEAKGALNRINYLFLELLRIIATGKHPLVVFLDDLQWIDAASLNLMQTILRSSGISHLLIIGAYRDNEVDAFHPLSISLELLQKEQTNITRMPLHDLSKTDVNELIAQTLNSPPKQTDSLTNLIYAKTGGNPFFLRQMLKTLEDRQALTFDAGERCWKWELSRLEKMEITDNVVSLMLRKIQQLSSETQRVLSLAACIGFKFDIRVLSIISEQPQVRVLEDLHLALHEGMILHIDEKYKFAHDRIQQAAYSLIPDEKKKNIHLRIGKLLQKALLNQDDEEHLFMVVDHCNIGSELLSDKNEQLEFARSNLRAGIKAKAAAAFAAANNYFEYGVGMLTNDSWESDYALTLELFSRAAESASLAGNFERTEQIFTIITENAKMPSDMSGAYISKMMSLSAQGLLPDFMDCALEILDRLSIHIEPHPSPEYIMQALADLRNSYDPDNIEELISLPETDDPLAKNSMRVLDLAQNSAYSGRPDLFALFAFEGTKRNLKYGITPESMHSFTHFALLLLGLPGGDIEEGYQFGMVAKKLAENAPNSPVAAATMGTTSGMIWPFKRHLHETLDMLKPLFPRLKEIGDFEYAGYILCWYCCNALLSGMELVNLEHEMAESYKKIRHIRAEVAIRWLLPFWQTAQNLLGKSEFPWIVNGEVYDRQSLLPVIVETGNLAAQTALHVNTLSLCYLFNRYDEALEASNLTEQCRTGMVAMPIEPIWYFYDSLTRLALYTSSQSEKETYLERIAANQAYLGLRAQHAPMNYLNKWHLVEAERARVLGDIGDAIQNYDQAILLAQENKLINEEALANELTAKFWLENGKDDIARLYMTKAHLCYKSWGALCKVQDLEKQYSDLLTAVPVWDSSGITPGQLDFSTLMKTAQAISGEMEMDRLLEKVMQHVIENAGAQRGFLLMEQHGAWKIVARKDIERQERDIFQPIHLEESSEIASGLVRFVANSMETVVLDDAVHEGDFVGEAIIKNRNCKSLLCTPFTSRGRLVGILYLENNLVTYAFTPERIDLLEILLSLAATSLENANIYEALKESEFKYRQIVETANEGVWVLGPDTMTVSVNFKMAEMLGYKPEDMIGKPVTAFMVQEDWTNHEERMEIRRSGIAENYERRFIRKDGQIVWTLASAAPIFDADKHYNGSFAMFTDVTEQKKAEESLKKSEALLSTVQRISKVGGWEYDIQSGKSFWTNELYRIHEIPNDPDIDHLTESQKCYRSEDRKTVMDAFNRACEYGESYDFEFPFTTFKGNHLWIRTTAHPIYEENKLVRLVGNIMDITERKQAEEEIQKLNQDLEERVIERTSQLEAANKELEAFAYSVSHDLRAPLRHIDGFLELLQKQTVGSLDERSQHYMDTISDSARRMGQLINDLLTFSRLGRNELVKTPIELDALVQEVISEFAPETQGRTVNWHIANLPTVSGDRAMLRQALVNLISNALKYTRRCTPTNIEIGYQAGDQETIIFIRDNGVGFDMAYADKLFGVFQRLHHADEFEGTGIGLANVRRIIQRHNGRTWAKGQIDKGATFYFSLPQSTPGR